MPSHDIIGIDDGWDISTMKSLILQWIENCLEEDMSRYSRTWCCFFKMEFTMNYKRGVELRISCLEIFTERIIIFFSGWKIFRPDGCVNKIFDSHAKWSYIVALIFRLPLCEYSIKHQIYDIAGLIHECEVNSHQFCKNDGDDFIIFMKYAKLLFIRLTYLIMLVGNVSAFPGWWFGGDYLTRIVGLDVMLTNLINHVNKVGMKSLKLIYAYGWKS